MEDDPQGGSSLFLHYESDTSQKRARGKRKSEKMDVKGNINTSPGRQAKRLKQGDIQDAVDGASDVSPPSTIVVDLEGKVKSLEEDLRKARETIKSLLMQNFQHEMDKRTRRINNNCANLGHHMVYRVGTQLEEKWHDGEQIYELRGAVKRLLEEKEEIEKLRKKNRAKQRKMNAESTGTGESGSDYANAEFDAILKFRISSIKREENELQSKLEDILIQKKLHVREMKVLRDQENSRFNRNVVLHDRYLLLELIGKGGFSEVYHAYDLTDFKHVACKIHQLNPAWNEEKKRNYIRHSYREYTIHKQLDHPHVVKLYNVFEIDKNAFCTCLEYCPKLDLDLYLIKNNNILPEKEAKAILAQICLGLQYLNNQPKPIIHFDLKPGNIIFSGYSEAKITDFGLSKEIIDPDGSGVDLTSQGAGTYWYLPPECFEVGKVARISTKVDVWSVGVIFFQMLYGRKPFGHDQSQRTILKEGTIYKVTSVDFPPKPSVSNEAKDVIRKCLIPNQDLRLDIDELVNDPYLQNTPSIAKAHLVKTPQVQSKTLH